MQLKESDGTLINKQTGKIVYEGSATTEEEVLFNTLSTPRGGEYQLLLADGSKVWLNAASSLTFPTRFAGKERTVFLHGEAYFEVTKNKEMPFHVQLDNAITVEVLGTHFNVMGYGDERETNTTLVEGAVKVITKTKAALLSPSMQAVIKKGEESIVIGKAGIAKASSRPCPSLAQSRLRRQHD